MPFRRCKACVVGRAVAPIAYWEIGPTTQRKSAVLCVHVTSRRCSQCAIRKTAAVWDVGAGYKTYLRVVDYFRLARQIGRVVSEPKVITHAAKLAVLGRILVHRPDDDTTCTYFASKVLNHPDVVG